MVRCSVYVYTHEVMQVTEEHVLPYVLLEGEIERLEPSFIVLKDAGNGARHMIPWSSIMQVWVRKEDWEAEYGDS
jgi:hypothetical protein